MPEIDLNLLTPDEIEEARKYIKWYIQNVCLYIPNPEIQYHPTLPKGRIPPKIDGNANGIQHLFLLRRVLYNPKIANLIYLLFIDAIIGLRRSDELPEDFQIGGMEASSIALLSGLQQTMVMLGMKAPNIITVRKDRKNYGIFQFADGEIGTGPIIFMDDIIHSGNTFYRFADVIEYELKLKIVPTCFCILTFHEDDFPLTFEIAENKQCTVGSIFTTKDFDYTYNPEMEETLGDDILWKNYSGWKNTVQKL